MTSLANALKTRRSVRSFSPRPLTKAVVESLVWAAQGRTRGDGNRTAPSAHALHPLRLFVTAGRIDGLETGHYAVDHETGALNPIHGEDIRPALQAAAVDDQTWVGNAACILSICADFVTACRDFADQMPYGQRGPRYVWIEAGAAAQNALLQAASDEIGGVLVAGFSDERTAQVLDLDASLMPVLHLCFGWETSAEDGNGP